MNENNKPTLNYVEEDPKYYFLLMPLIIMVAGLLTLMISPILIYDQWEYLKRLA